MHLTAFRDISITRKQMMIIMSTTMVALLLACAAFVGYTALNQRQSMSDSIYMLAKIISGNSTAAINLEDARSADAILSALSADKGIVAAAIFNIKGKPLAKYRRNSEEDAMPNYPLADGYRVSNTHAELYRPIIHDGVRIGTVAIKADMAQLSEQLRKYLEITTIVLLGALLAAFFLSTVLQKVISRPILDMLETARRVAAEQDYSIRAEKFSEDETGMLADGLNQMLQQIQERDQALQASKAQVEELSHQNELILMSAGDGIYGVDTEGRTTFANPAAARLLGWDENDLIGKPAKDVLRQANGSENSNVAAQVLSSIREGKAYRADDVVFVRKNETTFPAEYISTPIVHNGNQPVGAVFTFKDISDRKEAEEKLRSYAQKLKQSNSELENFANVASHDLQEPLRKVRAFGDRLKRKCIDDLSDEGKDYIDRMQNAAERMQILINDVLAFSRVTTKAKPFEPVNLGKEVAHIISDLEVRIETTRGKVVVDELPTLSADPTQMRQLFQNILGNALKFHRKDVPPVVTVTCRELVKHGEGEHPDLPPAKRYEFTISDNGIGFENKYLDRIFQVFQRLHSRQDYEGTGIGLAICRKIVERHGGTITANSEPDVGTTFTFILPENPPQKQANPEEPKIMKEVAAV